QNQRAASGRTTRRTPCTPCLHRQSPGPPVGGTRRLGTLRFGTLRFGTLRFGIPAAPATANDSRTPAPLPRQFPSPARVRLPSSNAVARQPPPLDFRAYPSNASPCTSPA